MTRRRDLKPKMEAAVKLIEDTQNQDGQPSRDGGWRYQPQQGDADMSVTVVQVLGLRGCRNAGIKVSQSTIDRAINYMKRLANTDGGFSYQYGMNQSNPARTGAGVLSLYLAGMRRFAAVPGRAALPGQASAAEAATTGSIAITSTTRSTMSRRRCTRRAATTGKRGIRASGTDLSPRRTRTAVGAAAIATSEAGPEYATAMACLVLQVPAGLLPIYQK